MSINKIKGQISYTIKSYSDFLIPAFTAFLCFFFNPPLQLELFNDGLWQVEIEQSKDFLNNSFLENVPYGFNRALRLVPPLFFRFFGIESPYMAYILQVVLNILLVGIGYQITKESLQSNIKQTFLFMIAISTLYFFNSSFGDTFGHADTFGFLFMLLAMQSRNRILISLWLFLGFFCSERVLFVGLPSIIVYWIFRLDGHFNKFLKKEFIGVIISVILYYTVRLWLISKESFGVSLPVDMGLGYLLQSKSFFQIYFYSFTGLWILVISLWSKKLDKKYLLLLIPMGLSFSSFLVADQTRGMAHIFPIFFILLTELKKEFDTKSVNLTLSIIALICVLSPSYNFLGTYVYKPSLFYYLTEKFILENTNSLFEYLR